ncbi:MAG: hypothetical protein WA667_00270 [Candidatus Nitrosopolaris sp.]
MSLADHQSKNVPIRSGRIVPKDELARTSILSKRISKKKIEELAIQKYRTCGQGIDFVDVMKFGCSKTKAQRILKDCSQQRIGHGSGHAPFLFRSPKRTSPQRYYPSVLRADILEKLKQRSNVPIQLTEVTSSDANSKTSSNAPLSNLEEQKAQNLLDALHLLGHSPLYIHKLQLQLSLDSGYYIDIQKDSSKYNKAKQHEEKIGTALVKYLVYPNGKTMVFVACSNNPFKLEDEADESILYSFLGQVRDRLLYLVTDPHERIVPPITEWILTGCDINRDVTVTDMLQVTAINIQLKDADRVFRLYIKSLGDKAVYRIEESVKMRSSLVDVLHTIRSPSEPQNKEK